MDMGQGVPVVLVPGIQGRWEWMDPAVEALAKRCRVITGSLPGDRGSLCELDAHRGFDAHLDWLDQLLDGAGVKRAALCGVSYGGLVALHYAAQRPARVSVLILASTPSPRWTPNCRVEGYLRTPRLMSPIFALSSPFRLYPEIARAFPGPIKRAGFLTRHLYRIARHPFAPTKIAERVRLMGQVDFADDCTRIDVPTLVVTGEPELDRVVPVFSTHEYLSAIPSARAADLADTGHIGLVTRPARFAAMVETFATAHGTAPGARMRGSA